MLCRSKSVKTNDLFQIPFGPIASWNEITTYYPHVQFEMDGSSADSFLSFFYELNPINSVYKFKDDDSENDFADLLGINFSVISEGESKEDENKRKMEQERIEALKIFTEEYDRLMNPDSISSLSSMESLTNKKEEKKLRRRKLIESRRK